jgi:hypothetical protein
MNSSKTLAINLSDDEDVQVVEVEENLMERSPQRGNQQPQQHEEHSATPNMMNRTMQKRGILSTISTLPAFSPPPAKRMTLGERIAAGYLKIMKK